MFKTLGEVNPLGLIHKYCAGQDTLILESDDLPWQKKNTRSLIEGLEEVICTTPDISLFLCEIGLDEKQLIAFGEHKGFVAKNFTVNNLVGNFGIDLRAVHSANIYRATIKKFSW